jgi:hypothetical protein
VKIVVAYPGVPEYFKLREARAYDEGNERLAEGSAAGLGQPLLFRVGMYLLESSA